MVTAVESGNAGDSNNAPGKDHTLHSLDVKMPSQMSQMGISDKCPVKFHTTLLQK